MLIYDGNGCEGQRPPDVCAELQLLLGVRIANQSLSSKI